MASRTQPDLPTLTTRYLSPTVLSNIAALTDGATKAASRKKRQTAILQAAIVFAKVVSDSCQSATTTSAMSTFLTSFDTAVTNAITAGGA